MAGKLFKHLKKRPIKLALEIGLILLVFTGIKTWQERNMISGTPPALHAQLLTGEAFKLESLQGKPVLLHFWASWCKICRLEQGSIENISKDHTVISIAMKSGDANDISQYMTKHQLSFPVIIDASGDISHRYGVYAVPANFILDPAGKIIFKSSGFSTEWGLRLRLWLAD